MSDLPGQVFSPPAPIEDNGDGLPEQQNVTDTAAKIMAELEKLIQLRLTPDALRLEIFLAAGASRKPFQARIDAVIQRCQELALDPAVTPERARQFLTRAKEKQWVVVAQGTAAIAPKNGSLDVLLSISTATELDRFRARTPVRKGQAIVRIHPARDGQPGRDLRGREIPAAPAHQLSLPAGSNSLVGEDESGPAIVAGCDGEAYLDHLKFHVRPMHLFTSRELVHQGPRTIDGPVLVVGDIPSGTQITATGDIVVTGEAEESILISTGGSITVLGCVTGHHLRHGRIEAVGDIALGSALHVDVATPANIYIQTQARNATLKAGGHLFLFARLRHALYDTDLQISGAVIPFDNPGAPADVASDERMTFDAACDIAAHVAIHEASGVVFQDCHIVEMSVAGARLVLGGRSDGPPLAANKIVHLKFVLPHVSPLQVLARTLPPHPSGGIAVTFRQISHQDEAHITAFCLELLRARQLGSPQTSVASPPAQS